MDFDGTGFSISEDGGGNMPLADVQSLLRGITYDNTSQNPTTGNRTLDIEVQDVGGLISTTATSTITVSAVNDTPTLAASAANDSLTENTDVTSGAVFPTVTIDPIETGDDIASAQLTIAGGIENTDTLTINGTAITGLGSDSSGAITGGHSYSYTQATGVVTITFAGSTNAAAAELVLENITYGIDAADNDPSTTARTVTLTLSDIAAGSLSTATSGAVTSTFVGGVWTASGAIADVNTLLAGVTFNPALNYNSNFTIGTSVDDGVAAAI
ncbi:MAG: hypothetical protein GY926_07540, partial [bacterium]|nr:hypothetical protein [bacterium]